jgi:hypothetical protein
MVFFVGCYISIPGYMSSYDEPGFGRAEAYNSYKASPLFLYWDPTILETFMKYGIMEDKEHGANAVKLKGPVFLVPISKITDP